MTLALKTLLGVGVLLLAAQIIPYGKDHTNPPVLKEPAWDRPETRRLARLACFDCHSNETVWPWYSKVAPVSWLVYRDVTEGRAELNFSEWDRPQKEAKESAKVIRNGEMPPSTYLPTHPEARLSPLEREALAAGLQASLGSQESVPPESAGR
ncbi:MAG TPA: heme-binding domain-containing protein [Bryobacteraceae bacterium]|nr:heme-binding domain-containing protein [Bryobacteraceae bacterium]